MHFSRLTRLTCCVLALLLAVSAVNLTAPAVVRTAAESAPDADDDESRTESREGEFTVPGRHTSNLDRPAPLNRFPNAAPVRGARTPRAVGNRTTSPDLIGARLRC